MCLWYVCAVCLSVVFLYVFRDYVEPACLTIADDYVRGSYISEAITMSLYFSLTLSAPFIQWNV